MPLPLKRMVFLQCGPFMRLGFRAQIDLGAGGDCCC